jgi:hypothetical protein
MIRFEEITNKNIWKVCTLEPFDDQKDYVADNIQSLAEAYATRNEGNNALPLAVYNFGDAKKVWLSYEPENTHAREIYQKYGFAENGDMCGNEIVAVYEL